MNTSLSNTAYSTWKLVHWVQMASTEVEHCSNALPMLKWATEQKGFLLDLQCRWSMPCPTHQRLLCQSKSDRDRTFLPNSSQYVIRKLDFAIEYRVCIRFSQARKFPAAQEQVSMTWSMPSLLHAVLSIASRCLLNCAQLHTMLTIPAHCWRHTVWCI